MGFFQAERSAAWFRGCIVLRRTGRPRFQGSERRNLRIPSRQAAKSGETGHKAGMRPRAAPTPIRGCPRRRGAWPSGLQQLRCDPIAATVAEYVDLALKPLRLRVSSPTCETWSCVREESSTRVLRPCINS
jgi:hypothetical protein